MSNLLFHPRIDHPSSRLLRFRRGRYFTVKDSFEGIGFMGGISGGKTSAATNLQRAMLDHEYGILILSVKKGEADAWESAAARAGRSADFYRVKPGSGLRFNPVEFESNPVSVVAMLQDLADTLGKEQEVAKNARYWRDESGKMLRNGDSLVQHATGRSDLETLAQGIADHAPNRDAVESKSWQDRSSLYRLLLEAERRSPGNHDVALAREYFLSQLPGYAPETRGCVLSVVGNLLENFRRDPIRELFTGKSNISPADVLDRRKIVCVDVPVLEDHTIGGIANGIWLFCFLRALTRRTSDSPAALWIDEAQFLVSGELMRTQTVIRSHSVSLVVLFQNLAVLQERLPEASVSALLGTINTMVYTRQPHPESCQWAADRIGKVWRERETRSRGSSSGRGWNNSKSVSTEKIRDYRFQPEEFAQLKNGGPGNGFRVQSIISTGAGAFRASWHQTKPGRWWTVQPLT